MFTGIVKTIGIVARLDQHAGGARLRIRCPELKPERWHTGDSIAVAGVCLTALDIDREGFSADLSNETLDCTSLGRLEVDGGVNLEPALAVGERLGGHWVTGHVDGLARLVSREPAGDSERLQFAVPDKLAHLIAAKGSVTLDGVSLTVNAVEADRFEVNLIPHTLKVTTLGALAPDDPVNLEVDLLARYLERILAARSEHGA